MGDYVLMKTKLLLLALPLIAFAQAPHADLKWVDEEIAAIQPPREGVSSRALYGLKDPFKSQLYLNQPHKAGATKAVAKKAPRRTHRFTLEAIINAKTAQIDGKWYKQDDKIYGYTIKKIESSSVVLQNKAKTLELSLVTKNDKIKINAK